MMKTDAEWVAIAGMQDFEMLHPTEHRNIFLLDFVRMVQEDVLESVLLEKSATDQENESGDDRARMLLERVRTHGRY